MTPQTAPKPQNLKGSQTTITGILAIIGGALGLFQQIMLVIHGGSIDPMGTALSVGSISSGVGLAKAADSKQ